MRVFRVIRSVFLTVAIIALCAVLVHTVITRISGKTPSVFGYSVFRVSSGSMKPELEVGDVILVKECDPMTVKEGDIVTYNGTKDEMAGKIVTHRVVKAPFKKDGEYYISTKGDANALPDPDVNVNEVFGTVQHKIVTLTFLYNIFVTPWGLIIIIALIILAFFNEIIIFIKSLLGIGYKEEKSESVEDIIERYQKENQQKAESEEENQ